MSKMTPLLADRFRNLPLEEAVDVVLELGDEAIRALDGASSVQQMKACFQGYAAPLKDKIKSMGGDVTGEGWLNGTLQAKLTRGAAESLTSDPAIARLDVPKVLERE